MRSLFVTALRANDTAPVRFSGLPKMHGKTETRLVRSCQHSKIDRPWGHDASHANAAVTSAAVPVSRVGRITGA